MEKYASVNELRQDADAWEGIESAVRQGEPAYPTVEEALHHSRRRPSPGRHMLETGEVEHRAPSRPYLREGQTE